MFCPTCYENLFLYYNLKNKKQVSYADSEASEPKVKINFLKTSTLPTWEIEHGN